MLFIFVTTNNNVIDIIIVNNLFAGRFYFFKKRLKTLITLSKLFLQQKVFNSSLVGYGLVRSPVACNTSTQYGQNDDMNV